MRRLRSWVVLTLLAAPAYAAHEFEIWLVDQSNSPGAAFGGTIHIYADRDVLQPNRTHPPASETIDLGGATTQLCLASTGVAPVRPHMLAFNSTYSHGVLSFVASGHVVFLDTRTRTPVACLRTEVGAGGARQAHAAWPTIDDRYVLVANQNGKKLERIATHYAQNTFVQEPLATLDLANCTTPQGVACQLAGVRPDNAPICPYTASDNGPAFVSLRGGGLFVVDHLQTPMQIIGAYDMANVPPNGCGFIEARGWIYANGGGGTAANLDQFAVYRAPMSGYLAANPANTPATQLLMNDESEHRDAHGVATTKHQRYVWIGDRARNVAEVFHSDSGERVNTVDLVSPHSLDPTPDLFDLSPDKQWMFMSLRGPVPLSGDPHSSTGSTPGLLVMKITHGGRDGQVRRVLRISNVDAGGVERADAHGIRVRPTCYD
jgi:hypothetical protein